MSVNPERRNKLNTKVFMEEVHSSVKPLCHLYQPKTRSISSPVLWDRSSLEICVSSCRSVLFLLFLLSFPRCPSLCGHSGLWGVSALRASLDPGYQSFIHSLISWSRSSLGLAPCGRERVQVPAGPLSQHRTQPGYTPVHAQKKVNMAEDEHTS